MQVRAKEDSIAGEDIVRALPRVWSECGTASERQDKD
jgi:hypothetical protein